MFKEKLSEGKSTYQLYPDDPPGLSGLVLTILLCAPAGGNLTGRITQWDRTTGSSYGAWQINRFYVIDFFWHFLNLTM